jgi:MFS family permease
VRAARGTLRSRPVIEDLRQRFITARRRLPAIYWTLWVGTLVNRLGGFVGPFLSFYLMTKHGFAEAEAGRMVALLGAGQVAGSMAGGALADRVGRRPTLLVSLLGGAVMMVALGFARTAPQIALFTFALGLIGEMYRPAVAAVISDVVPEADRLYAFGLLFWVINLAFAFAPITAGLIASVSFLALFLIDAATMLGYGIIVWRRVPETRPPVVTTSAPPAVSLFTVLRDRTFLPFLALTFGQSMMLFQISASLTAQLLHQGHDQGDYGLILALNGLLIVLFQPAVTRRLTNHDRPRVLALAAIGMGLGFSLHGVSGWLVMHAVAIAVWTMAEICLTPTSSAVVATLAPAHARGRYQGVYTMSWGLAMTLAPIAGPEVMARFGAPVLWGGCLVLGGLVALGYLAWGPVYRRAVAAPPA